MSATCQVPPPSDEWCLVLINLWIKDWRIYSNTTGASYLLDNGIKFRIGERAKGFLHRTNSLASDAMWEGDKLKAFRLMKKYGFLDKKIQENPNLGSKNNMRVAAFKLAALRNRRDSFNAMKQPRQKRMK